MNIPEHTEPGLKRGTYKRILSDGKPVAKFTCPQCDFTANLGGGTHEIAKDGVVTPSVVCDGQGCMFHDWIALVGWRT